MADYNWDKPARVFHHSSISRTASKESIEFDTERLHPPEAVEAMRRFIVKYRFTHGDIIRFNDYRDSETFIFLREEDGKLRFIKNQDDSGAGYLTIPWRILENVKDCVHKYAKVIKLCPAANFHMAPDDRTIRELLGDHVPRDWQFDVHYIDGTLAELWIRPLDIDWERFDVEGITLEKVRLFFEGAREEPAELFIHVDLKDESYISYRDKYGDSNSKYAWINAKPDVTPTWSVNRGASTLGPNTASWTWVCKGPRSRLDLVMEAFFDYLNGFKYTYSLSRDGDRIAGPTSARCASTSGNGAHPPLRRPERTLLTTPL